MKCPKQLDLACPFCNIGASASLMVAFSGFYESHEPPPSGNACSIVPAHRDDHRIASKVGTFCIIVVALAAVGAIRRE